MDSAPHLPNAICALYVQRAGGGMDSALHLPNVIRALYVQPDLSEDGALGKR